MTNIVMLVRDRLRLTEQSLLSLYTHTPQDQFTLTIVDDESQDFRVRRLITHHASYANATMIRLYNSRHVLSQAKNIGVAWSEQYFGRGEWLYLSDNDVYFQQGWLDDLTRAARISEGSGYRLWGGQIHPFHKDIGTYITVMNQMILREYSILDGPSWLMRWGTWDMCGPLTRDTAPGVCQSEEYPFCKRVVSTLDNRAEVGSSLFGRIGVIHPHVVLHTGLTNSDGKDAPGRKERESLMVKGVLYE